MFAGSAEISLALQQDLTDPNNELYFSDASAWEIVIKNALGKSAVVFQRNQCRQIRTFLSSQLLQNQPDHNSNN